MCEWMLLFSLEQFRVFKKKHNTWNSVSQTGPLTIGGSPGGAQTVLEEKALQTLNKLKNTLIHACTETAFVGRPSTGSRRIISFHNFLFFGNYFDENTLN
jgi:hypothetical protein